MKGVFLGSVFKTLQQENLKPNQSVQFNVLDSFSRSQANKSSLACGLKDNQTTHIDQSYLSNVNIPQKDSSVEVSFDAKPMMQNNRLRIKLKEVCKRLTGFKQDCAIKLSQVEFEGIKLKESKISIYNLLTREIDATMKKDEEVVRHTQSKVKRLLEGTQQALLEIETLYESCTLVKEEEVEQSLVMVEELERQICGVRAINLDLVSQNFKIISQREYQQVVLQVQEAKQRELQELNLNQSLIYQNEQKISNALTMQLEQNKSYIDELKDQLRSSASQHTQLGLEEKLALEQRTIQHLQDKLLLQHAKQDDQGAVMALQGKLDMYHTTLQHILGDSQIDKERPLEKLQEMLLVRSKKIDDVTQKNTQLTQDNLALQQELKAQAQVSQQAGQQIQYELTNCQELNLKYEYELLNLNQAQADCVNIIKDIQAQNDHLHELNNYQSNQITQMKQFSSLQHKEREASLQEEIHQSNFKKSEADTHFGEEQLQQQQHLASRSKQRALELEEENERQRQELAGHLKKKDQEIADTQDQLKRRQTIFNDKIQELHLKQQNHIEETNQQYLKQINLLKSQHDHEIQRLQMQICSTKEQEISLNLTQQASQYSTNQRPPKTIIHQAFMIKSPQPTINESPSEEESPQSGSFYNEVTKFQKELDNLSQESSILKPGFMRKRISQNIFIEDRSLENDSHLTQQSPFTQTFNLASNMLSIEPINCQDSGIQSDAQNEDIFPPYDHRVCLRCKRNDMVAPNFCKYQEVHSIKDMRESTVRPKKTWQVNKKHVYGTNIGWRQKEDSFSSIKQSSYMSNKSEKYERGINTILQLVNDQNCQKYKRNGSVDKKINSKQRNSSVDSVSSSSKLNISVNF